MKKIFSIIVIILLGTITSQAAFLLLLHEKMKKHNQLIIRLTKMKEDKNYKDSTLYGPSNAELDMAVSYYDRGAYQTALPQLDRISKEGNANARYFLARCYYYGQGTEQNYSIAIDLLGQNHGITLADANSCFLLSRCFRYGKGTTTNYEKADSLVIEAACRGLNEAIELLQIEKEMSRNDVLDWLVSLLNERMDKRGVPSMEEIRKRKESIEKELKDAIEDSVPKFGLG